MVDVTPGETVGVARSGASRSVVPTLVLIPLAFAVLGLLLRYAAYATVVPDASLANFADGLCRWDCQWYVKLAQSGYDPFPVPSMVNAGNWAFFPTMPMLVGLLRLLSGLPTIMVATATSIVLSMITAMLAWPLLGRNVRAYALFSAYLLCGPFSIYFTTFFTEALFILFTVAVFSALQRSDYIGAGLFAALLSATRIVGVFVVFALVVRAFEEHRQAGGTVKSFVPAVLKRPDIVLAIFLAPLGLFAYMAFLHFWIGDGLAFSHVQRAWGRAEGNPLGFLWTALVSGPKTGFIPSASQQLALAVLTGLALTGYMFWKRQFAAATFSFICLVLPLSAGMASTLRFTAALAPVVVTLVNLLSRHPVIFWIALAAFPVLDYFITIAWLSQSLALV